LIDGWKQFAANNGYPYLLIVKDLEDKDIFPVYFHNEKDMERYKRNIISESKLKIVKEINLCNILKDAAS
jgi:hypothetical protein